MLIAASCNNTAKVSELDKLFSSKSESLVNYADGFDIYHNDGVYKLDVYALNDPDKVFYTCYLTENSGYAGKENVFIIPSDSVAVLSATQLNAFDVLGLLDDVVGISESEYIRNKDVKKLLNEGRIQNLAANGNFFLEKVLEISPRIIFYSPYNINQKHPLVATELPMVPYYDYLETNPLGRAEWIKFTALFFNRMDKADSIFDTIVGNYNYYKELTEGLGQKPTVFSDKYFAGQWYVPGGESYIAHIFKDAGAQYLWADNKQNASFCLDFETVYSKAHNADYWRIVGTYPGGFSYDKLGAENDLYTTFDAFKNHKVIFCDSKKSNYFETGTLEPHILLGDLIFAFHPKLLPGYKPKYYYLYNH